MKFPVNSVLAGNFGLFRDEFARDCLLQRGVSSEPGGAAAPVCAGPLPAVTTFTLSWPSKSSLRRQRCRRAARRTTHKRHPLGTVHTSAYELRQSARSSLSTLPCG